MFSNFKIVYYIAIVFALSSCFESKEVRVTIVDKSFNKNDIAQTNRKIVMPQTKNTTPSQNTIKTKQQGASSNNSNVAWISPIDASVYQGFSKSNQGITFNSKKNTKVKAIADGQVVYSGNNLKAYGYMVIVKHKFGFYSHYMFNNNALVVVGDNITQGQHIATTGENKFYLSMKKFTTVVNPEKYISF